jgi:hypothetical protein
MMSCSKSESRIPKSETNPKLESRNTQTYYDRGFEFLPLFELRVCFEFRYSSFEFTTPDTRSPHNHFDVGRSMLDALGKRWGVKDSCAIRLPRFSPFQLSNMKM